MKVWPAQDAKARFSELLDTCQREGPQVVSRRGRETAVLVPVEECGGCRRRRDRASSSCCWLPKPAPKLLCQPEARLDVGMCWSCKG